MNRVIWGVLAGVVLGAAVTGILLRHRDTGEEGKPEEQHENAFVHRGVNGETFLKLDKETQARMGLRVSPLAAVTLKSEVKGYGRVLDPTPLASLLAEGASAKAALEASSREYERLKVLAQNQNASTRALEAAEAAMKRDQILLDSVQPRLLLGWGKGVAGQADLPAFVHALAAQEIALVRVDLPLGESLAAPPTGGRVASLTAPESPAATEYLGPAPNADPSMQGQGLLFLLKSNPLPVGAAVVAWLTVPGEPQSGVVVPREALLRHEGQVFVYLQTGDDTFRRQGVALERPLDNGWFVHDGLKPQDQVVVVGAQELLSEELKGQGGEE